jgi:hypothetical protein
MRGSAFKADMKAGPASLRGMMLFVVFFEFLDMEGQQCAFWSAQPTTGAAA